MTVHVYTSFTFSYLNRARVLAETLKKHHPDWTIWAVITDREPNGFRFDLESEHFDRMLSVFDLFPEDRGGWIFGMDIVEACTAVKGRALRTILNVTGVSKVLYFDPDIAVFSDLKNLSDALDYASIALTPHQVDPEPRESVGAIFDNEVSSLQYGTYNLGFLGVRNDHEGRRFAEWWDYRLQDYCHDRLDVGIFVDQKWCNLIPCFFDNVKVIRDPGCNVASWNLSQRTISATKAGDILVNGETLKFYHFTKLGPVGDEMTKRYAGDNILVYEIWWWYNQQVNMLTDHRIPARYWAFDTFVNGEKIPKKLRELYRSDKNLKAAYPAPFNDAFMNWARKNFKG